MITKTELQGNNLDLRTILNMVNNLPNKGSGTGEDISEELTAQDTIIADIQAALDEAAVPEGGKSFAIIGVVYSEGSTCTCAKGDKVLTLKDTDGKGFFAVPEAGDWTVTAGDRSETVSITEEGQVESLNLASFYIFKSGEGLAEGYSIYGKAYGGGVVGNWTPIINDSFIQSTESGSRTWAIAEPVDLRKYKVLKARVLLNRVDLNGGAKMVLGVTTTQLSNHKLSNILTSAEIGSESVGQETIMSVDISNINDSFYIGWDMEYTINYVYDIWLE